MDVEFLLKPYFKKQFKELKLIDDLKLKNFFKDLISDAKEKEVLLV